jgi:hypothetical protein
VLGEWKPSELFGNFTSRLDTNQVI